MPSRLMSLLILIYWSIAAFCLLKWDVLPELTMGYPPDLRGIAFASDSTRPVRWSIQVVDDPRKDTRRTVGEAVTTTVRQADGWYEMTSRVEFDAGDLLRGTLLSPRDSLKIQVDSGYHVDPTGNLQSFEVRVTSKDLGDEVVHVSGRLRDGRMEITSRGPMPILNNRWSPKYEPRSVVSDILGPLDRLPGLHVGQRWEMQVVNPFTGQVEQARAQVTRRVVIHWEGNPVSTYEVEQKMSSLLMHTWVRPDGVILRQEVPFPLVRLVLERRGEDGDAVSDPATVPAPAASRRPSP
jgi:hypothetical protein